jgi:hypothetical protein
MKHCGAHVVVALCSPLRVFVFLEDDRMVVPPLGICATNEGGTALPQLIFDIPHSIRYMRN